MANSGSFKKGHVPWHKGKKGLTLNTGRTHFKKGHSPWVKGKKFEYTPHYNRRGKRMGETNNMWKGGITRIGITIRTSSLYKEWRNEIFKRDNYTCRLCGEKEKVSGKLQVDHWPVTFSEIMKKHNIKSLEEAKDCSELWNIDCNRTLCRECHRQTDTYLYKSAPQNKNHAL